MNELIIGIITEFRKLIFDVADRFGTKFAQTMTSTVALFALVYYGKLEADVGAPIIGVITVAYCIFDQMKRKTNGNPPVK